MVLENLVVDIYASEQEQVDAIKRWLKENGAPIVVGLILGIGGISGWRYWQAHERARAENASMLFTQVVAAVKSERAANAEKLAQQLLGEYGKTTYAAFGALMLAKLAAEKQDLATAKQQLNWVLEHADDPILQRLAHLRLARVLLAEGKPADAWSEVQNLSAGTPSAAVAELRGDILLAQGKRDEAGKQYLEAYAYTEPAEQENEASALALKLDNLGIAPSMPTVTPAPAP